MTSATVHIACSVHNNERYLTEFLASVQGQTHRDWVLWLRDDGSRDGSRAILEQAAAADSRIRLMPDASVSLGVTSAFAWVLERIPAEASYLMFADADDVWLPEKIALMQEAMHRAEAMTHAPILVHSDLIVVDHALQIIDRSFWHYAHIAPESTSLRDVVVRNPVTGAATMFNAALRTRMSPVPDGAGLHDWWAAAVAAVTGHIIAVSTPTVLYRQHGDNAVGARRPSSTWSIRRIVAEVPAAIVRTDRVRTGLATAARQAAALHTHLGNVLPESDAAFLTAFAKLPQRGWWRRKVELARLNWRPQNGFVQNFGVFLRG